MLTSYNTFESESKHKAFLFESLLKLCISNEHLEIIYQNAKKVPTLTKDWNMSGEERANLYHLCFTCLNENHYEKESFEVALAFLNLYET